MIILQLNIHEHHYYPGKIEPYGKVILQKSI